MERELIEKRLCELDAETPWSHMFDFGNGVTSISPTNETFFKKATGLHKVGEVLTSLAESEVRGHTLIGKTVLDLACGEGGHSIQFARKGSAVLGIEGRALYVDRARFAAEALGVSNVRFQLGDIRKLTTSLQPHDIVVFSGILHHLGIESFDDIISDLGRITKDILLIYTHVSTEVSVEKHRLQGPVMTPKGRKGHLFREHSDNATTQEREAQVRASLDNTFSFWAQERDLVAGLNQSGFRTVLKVLSPHVFGWERASYRLLLVARK